MGEESERTADLYSPKSIQNMAEKVRVNKQALDLLTLKIKECNEKLRLLDKLINIIAGEMRNDG